MSAKTQRITAKVLLYIPSLVLVIGGVTKLSDNEPESVMAILTRFGFADKFIFLGLLELFIAAFLFIPKTIKTGFLLATAYFGGALCIEIGSSQPPASPVFLILLWIGMYLHDKNMFLTNKQ